MTFRFITIILFYINSSIFVLGQTTGTKDSLKVRMVLNKIVKNNSDLQAEIIVKNISTDSLTVYKDLQYGDRIGSELYFDRTNFVVVLEEKKGSRFVENSHQSHIDFALNLGDTLDDREKIILAPTDSITYFFHLDVLSGFKPGNHRARCYYTNHFKATGGIPSDWVYFQVQYEIFPKHDY